MISTALFAIILVLINAPAWTYALLGAYFTFRVVEYVNTAKAKKKLLGALDEIQKAVEEELNG